MFINRRVTETEHDNTIVLNACFRLSPAGGFIERVMGGGILLIYLSDALREGRRCVGRPPEKLFLRSCQKPVKGRIGRAHV